MNGQRPHDMASHVNEVKWTVDTAYYYIWLIVFMKIAII